MSKEGRINRVGGAFAEEGFFPEEKKPSGEVDGNFRLAIANWLNGKNEPRVNRKIVNAFRAIRDPNFENIKPAEITDGRIDDRIRIAAERFISSYL